MKVDNPQGSFIGAADAAIESIIEGSEGDVVIFTDSYVKRGSLVENSFTVRHQVTRTVRVMDKSG